MKKTKNKSKIKQNNNNKNRLQKATGMKEQRRSLII
jgi:hypothetical protein